MTTKTIQLKPGLSDRQARAEVFDDTEFPAQVEYDTVTGLVTKTYNDPPVKTIDDVQVEPNAIFKDVIERLEKIDAKLDDLLDDAPTETDPGKTPLWRKWLGLG